LNNLRDESQKYPDPADFQAKLNEFKQELDKEAINESEFHGVYQIFEHFEKAKHHVDLLFKTMSKMRPEFAAKLVLEFAERLITAKKMDLIEPEITRVAALCQSKKTS